jgi:hypothetical protein
MSRLRSILRGTRQIRTVKIPLKNMVEADTPTSVDVGLAIIGDYTPILEGAARYAKEHSGEAKDGNEIYDYGKAVYTVAICCVDAESDPANPRPFFGDSDNPSVEERVSDVLSHPNIGRDTVMYLAEHQDLWQDECSPQGDGARNRTPEEYYQLIAEVASEGPLAFLRLSAGSRLKLVTFTANLLATLPMLSTDSGSIVGTTGTK